MSTTNQVSTMTPAVVDLGVRDLILRSWRSERSLDASTLDVAVDVGGNQIVLTGDVGSYTDRLTAHEIASGHATGLLPVRNRIVVRPLECDPTEPDAVLQARVEGAVRDAAPYAAVRISARDHVVRLSGRLGDDDERRRVHAAAARSRGVHFVDDRTTIAASDPRSGRTLVPVPRSRAMEPSSA
ncbi:MULTISPECIES: BON domain-containing protein [Curtobacterium]|uniref:BON domain-containing protein n=1 Tax=Curtobacterium citreum TaxID=2036 RepID=A0ABT2HCZ2_9MICO|nr:MULTISPECIES: BON domain-containing protein [Curtobacterium]MCS6521133.1 BON domain-containing protein [Curtobacterium citreum]TQJ27987.1 BON domain-containing protein [Curtobacterium citreum]